MVAIEREDGSAPVGFVATVSLLLMVVYTLIAAALGWYVHAIATDAAMEGARAGAIAGSKALAAERTRDLITTTLNADYASNISVNDTRTGIEVVVRSPIPGAGFLGADAIEVRAHAQRE
ncbi:Flp pilus assembly protein TadG [Trueperella bonasi]|uniref:Flp pilus assembly protein TadG n=1 Tax=Trueperella bonasi TaxID=312286 RepID=A0ABT9NEG1_9ACTO|nr:hypothetical protein [Trueperella bonasi]MDP9805765.1 Flp pilus assembly protein TadG [Trueperella bonasi]